MKKRNPEMDQLLVATASANPASSAEALDKFVKALELPLRKGIMSGSNIEGIFEMMDFTNTRHVEFPIDFINPGDEDDFTAFVMPNCGYIPQNSIEGDYITVPTYDLANSIDWCLKYARDANWNIVDRAIQVFRDGFTKKINDDAWHTILAAGLDRNAIVYDSAASSGQFTKRLVSLMKVFMRRNGGGNSTSLNQARLTDLYISPEAEEDIRNWNIDQVDEVTRREIFTSPDGLTSIFQVNLHSMTEFGEGQLYQTYYTSTLGGTLPAGDVELVVGLDLSANDSFVMPVAQELEVYNDPTLHRAGRAGVYGRMEIGIACLSSARVLLGSL